MGFIPILETTILGTYFWNFVQGFYADLRSSWLTGQQASIPFIRVFIGGRAIIRLKNSVTFPYMLSICCILFHESILSLDICGYILPFSTVAA